MTKTSRLSSVIKTRLTLVKIGRKEPSTAYEEIEQAIKELIERSYPELPAIFSALNDPIVHGDKKGVDEYYVNLLTEINGLPDKDS